jgi:hypothetical protein
MTTSCKYGIGCTRGGCYFAHPDGRVWDGSASGARGFGGGRLPPDGPGGGNEVGRSGHSSRIRRTLYFPGTGTALAANAGEFVPGGGSGGSVRSGSGGVRLAATTNAEFVPGVPNFVPQLMGGAHSQKSSA